MYEIGDFIIYGNNGVCRVESVGPLNSPDIPKDRVYYTLSPYYMKGSRIFTPADNQKVIMRPVISKDEALELIDNIKDIESLWIPDEKKQENHYKDALRKCDCSELVKIIKTIYLRKQSRLVEGKKITSSDEKYFQMAEDRLYGELAISLDMDIEEVKEYVVARVERQTVG